MINNHTCGVALGDNVRCKSVGPKNLIWAAMKFYTNIHGFREDGAYTAIVIIFLRCHYELNISVF